MACAGRVAGAELGEEQPHLFRPPVVLRRVLGLRGREPAPHGVRDLFERGRPLGPEDDRGIAEREPPVATVQQVVQRVRVLERGSPADWRVRALLLAIGPIRGTFE
jgi:hypothetical protein